MPILAKVVGFWTMALALTACGGRSTSEPSDASPSDSLAADSPADAGSGSVEFTLSIMEKDALCEDVWSIARDGSSSRSLRVCEGTPAARDVGLTLTSADMEDLRRRFSSAAIPCAEPPDPSVQVPYFNWRRPGAADVGFFGCSSGGKLLPLHRDLRDDIIRLIGR